MSFYEDLKKIPVYQPAPPPTQEDKIRRLMEDKVIRDFASRVMEDIKVTCTARQKMGKRRVFGFYHCYEDTKGDSDGYSYIDPYFIKFHEWKDGVRSQEREITTTAPTSHVFEISYNSWEQCQAIMRTLARLMAEEGFPDGCLSTYTRPMRYRERQIVHSFWSGKKEIFIDHDYEVYEVEVDIRW